MMVVQRCLEAVHS